MRLIWRIPLGFNQVALVVGATALTSCWTPQLTLPEDWGRTADVASIPDGPPQLELRQSFWENDALSRELPILVLPDGTFLRDGLERGWWRDGSPRLEQPWRMGERVGVARRWAKDGTPIMEVDRGDGETLAGMRFWYENGQLAGEGNGINALKQGPWTTWHPNGNMRSEGEYFRGLKE
ncbi:MAG: antitoxin component YwqK of YwqJK toxin-antitoxin module, partial [Planctomycetota bacterium]